MRILNVIPVRGGSKGIPRKNAAEVMAGVSLLEWTLRQAHEACPPDDVVVSTEDAELARIAAGCGARVVDRPAELAQDGSTTASVVAHLLGRVDPDASRYQAISILQVTSPLREADDIRRSAQMIASGRFDSVVSAYQSFDCHPAKLYLLTPEGAQPVLPELETGRRQDLPPVYRRNGAIFVVTRDFYARTGRLWGGRTGLVEMPRARSVDVDAPEDLEAVRRYLAGSARQEGSG